MLVCAGDLMLDILVTAEQLSDGMAGGIFVRPGGSAANVAAWCVHRGYPATWIGVACDTIGDRLLLEDLRRAGVQVQPLHSPSRLSGVGPQAGTGKTASDVEADRQALDCRGPVPFELGRTRRAPVADDWRPGGRDSRLPTYGSAETGVVISWIGRRGRRTMHSARWAGVSFGLDEASMQLPTGTAGLHLSAYPLVGPNGLTAAGNLLKSAGERGAFLSFDPSDVGIITALGPRALLSLLSGCRVDAIFANRREATALTGFKGPQRAANALSEFVPIAVIKDGGRGCFAQAGGITCYTPAERVQVVDTTGAGDAFAGAWLALYLIRPDVGAACRAANQAAGQAVTTIGGRPPPAGDSGGGPSV